jgi:hypothetical protein
MASKGHKDVVRRTWDTEQYEQRAKQREAAERAGKRYRPEDDREKEKEKSKEVRQEREREREKESRRGVVVACEC